MIDFNSKLYKAVYSNENLNEAWNKVKSNKGIAGVDDMDILKLGMNENVSFFGYVSHGSSQASVKQCYRRRVCF